MSKIVWVAIIVMIMVTAMLASAAEDIKSNIITERFQRLSDLPLFNNTDLIPRYIVDNALVPDRFYSSIEKKMNITQIIANNKNKYNIPDKINRIRSNISPNQYPSTSDNIIFSSNASIIWKRYITGGLLYSQVVDDLNGDSLKDILVVEYKYNIDTDTYTYILRAMRGTGNTIWSTSISGSDVWLYGFQIGDVNGDGLNDVMVKTYDYISGIETVKIKKGTTGTTIWQQSVTNGFIYAIPVRDLNGDGLNDILVQTYDYDTYAMALKAKKGTTGTTLWQESIYNGWIYGNPAGDLSGDEINDVLVQTYDYSTGIATLKAKKGVTGTILWQESIYNGWIYAMPVKDLNGDGLGDVLVQTYNYNTYASTLKAKKGITGTNLWTNSITNGALDGIPAGDLNGDGLNDVLVLTYNYSSYVATIKAKKGATGTTLWRESIYKGWIYGIPVDDLNGDGLSDVLVQINEPGINTVKAKKGTTGTNLWQTTSTDYIYPYQIGDIDGDTLNDIALDTYISDTNTDSLKIKKGKTGVTLWSKSIRGWMFAMPAGDLNKDGKNDLLLQLYKGGYYAILANKGDNGENIWKAESYIYISLGYYDSGIGYSGIKYDLNGDKQNDILMNIFNEIYLITTKSIGGGDGY